MNAIELARRAYAADSFHLKTERGVEAQIIGRVTARLKFTEKQKDKNFAAFAMAIHENRKLWHALALDVAHAENALPDDVRARIFYLSEFTELQSKKALKGETTVQSLIEINTAMMRGLNDAGAE